MRQAREKDGVDSWLLEGALQTVSKKDMIYQDEKPDHKSGFSDS